MAIKKLTLDEVPAELHKWFRFDDQILLPDRKDGSHKALFIMSWCSKCRCGYQRRVSHLRQYFKSGLDITFFCGSCRSDARWTTKDGYVMMYRPGHPNSRKDGGILEHVFVMSEMISRPLAPGENVHHKNGNRSDNRPENLELWSTTQPAGQRIEDKIRWAIELKDAYPTEWRRVRNQMRREACATEQQ